MEIFKLSRWLCQQKDQHEQEQNYSRFTKGGFQCNDSPPRCDKSWNVHWRGSFPLSPLSAKPSRSSPKNWECCLLLLLNRMFLLSLCISFWYCKLRRPDKKSSSRPHMLNLARWLVSFFCGRIEREGPKIIIMERWSIQLKRETTNIHFRFRP